MAPDSVVIIDDVILPSVGASWKQSSMDLAMMSMLAAMERTKEHFAMLLQESGLKLKDVWTYDSDYGDSFIVAVPSNDSSEKDPLSDGVSPNGSLEKNTAANGPLDKNAALNGSNDKDAVSNGSTTSQAPPNGSLEKGALPDDTVSNGTAHNDALPSEPHPTHPNGSNTSAQEPAMADTSGK